MAGWYTKFFRRRFCRKVLVAVILVLLCLYLLLRPARSQWFPKDLQDNTRWHPDKAYVHRFENVRENLSRTMVILLWTVFFGKRDWELGDLTQVFLPCKVKNCAVTSDHSKIKEADALLFHFPNSYDRVKDYPKYRNPHQVWVLENHEPPGSVRRDFRQLGGIFNWTMTYRRTSDIYVPYGKIQPLSRDLVDKTEASSAQIYKPTPYIAKTKTYGVLWAASNCFDKAMRLKIVRELDKYIHVNDFGSCRKRKGHLKFREPVDFEQYKFYLAFENGYCEDYITEKFWRSLKMKQIPVVVGVPDYKSIAPPHSYIDVLDFESIKDLGEYLKYLDGNDTAYNSYFEWMNHYEVVRKPMEAERFCDLCAALHQPRHHQTYTDIDGYMFDDLCLRYSVSIGCAYVGEVGEEEKQIGERIETWGRGSWRGEWPVFNARKGLFYAGILGAESSVPRVVSY